MLERDNARTLFDDVLGRVEPSLDAELRAEGGAIAQVTVRDGAVVEHLTRQSVRLVLRLGEPRSDVWAWGEATTTHLDADGLDRLVEHARAALHLATVDGTALAAASSRDFAPPELPEHALDPDLFDTGPAFRVHRVADPLLVARRYGFVCDGRYTLTLGGVDLDGRLEPFALGNNRGLFQHALVSRNQTLLRPAQPTAAPGFTAFLLAEGAQRPASDLDPQLETWLGLLDTLVTTDPTLRAATFGLDDSGLDSLDGLVLDAPAMAALLAPVLAAFSATAVARGLSPLAGIAPGDAVFGDLLGLRCDVADPRHAGVPFDHEGVPTQRVELLEQGRLAGLVWGRRRATADARGQAPTGHTVDAATGREAVRFPVMDGGESSLEAMVGALGDGLLVQRLRVAGPVPGAGPWRVALVAPDGALRVRQGKVTGAVGPWRAETDLDVLLGRLVELGPARRALGAVVPPVRIDATGGLLAALSAGAAAP